MLSCFAHAATVTAVDKEPKANCPELSQEVCQKDEK